MYRLAYYHSSTIAHLHAAHLRANGIMAGVIGKHADSIAIYAANNLGRGSYELHISTKRAKDQANLLLETLELENAQALEQDPFDDAPPPDLTKLAPHHIPNCPSCNHRCRTDRPQGPCDRCSTPYDLTQLVFESFGPEALEPCYETSNPLDDYTDEQVADIELDCPKCSYPLDGLGIQNHCPECGTPFNRRNLFSNLMNSYPPPKPPTTPKP